MKTSNEALDSGAFFVAKGLLTKLAQWLLYLHNKKENNMKNKMMTFLSIILLFACSVSAQKVGLFLKQGERELIISQLKKMTYLGTPAQTELRLPGRVTVQVSYSTKLNILKAEKDSDMVWMEFSQGARTFTAIVFNEYVQATVPGKFTVAEMGKYFRMTVDSLMPSLSKDPFDKVLAMKVPDTVFDKVLQKVLRAENHMMDCPVKNMNIQPKIKYVPMNSSYNPDDQLQIISSENVGQDKPATMKIAKNGVSAFTIIITKQGVTAQFYNKRAYDLIGDNDEAIENLVKEVFGMN